MMNNDDRLNYHMCAEVVKLTAEFIYIQKYVTLKEDNLYIETFIK